jgi:hypothetical protein
LAALPSGRGDLNEHVAQESSESGINWEEFIPEEDWQLYYRVISKAQEQGIDFALGGGLAFSEYAKRLRNTKDLDLFLCPEDSDRMIQIVREAGFEDYYDQQPYERHWIFRGYRDGVIIDVIWMMANHHTDVDRGWLKRGKLINVRGTEMRLIPVEELVWAKLFVMQRERCDWPDLLNVLAAEAKWVDWERLLDRLGDEKFLLGGLMNVFRWMCPRVAAELPEWIWEPMGLTNARAPEPCDNRRVGWLDSRDWFGAAPEGA